MSSLSITFKSLRSFPSLSRGTLCYQATVYVQGVCVGSIENRGDGGCSRLYPVDGSNEAQVLIEQARQFARTQTWTFGEQTHTYQLLEDYLDALAADEIDRAELASRCRRLMKGRVVLVIDDKLYEVKAPPAPNVYAALRASKGSGITILNELPVKDAVALYVKHAMGAVEASA